MAELIQRTDDLNTGREKLNNAILDAEDAKQKSDHAVNVSEQAKQIAQTAENKADNVQKQFNQVVIEGDSSVEAAQARVDADGNTFTTLKERLDTKETQFASRLAQIEQQKADKSKIGLLRKIRYKVEPPVGFNWQDPPLTIYVNELGEFSTDFDVTRYKHVGAGKTYYVDVNNGSDNNDGLSLETAFRNLSTAIQKSDVDIIKVAPGVYWRNRGFYDQTIRRNMSIIAIEPNTVQITTHHVATWEKTPGRQNVYQMNRSLVYAVYDSSIVDEKGDYYKLKKVDSITEVDNIPGSWYTENDIVYIHTIDSRPADDKIRPYMSVYNCNVSNDVTLYIEGIHFEGGSAGALRGDTGSRIYAKDCSFKYAQGNGGYQIVGAVEVFSQKCINARNDNDGFNYHANNGVTPKFIEVDCIGRDNGSQTNSNGSTAHGGAVGIRINGQYDDNFGPNVSDINIGTQTWNLGCKASGSVLRHGYEIGDGGEAWYDGCVGYGNEQLDLLAGSGGTAYVRNSILELTSGNVVEY